MSFLQKIAPQYALKRAIARNRLNRITESEIKRTNYESTTRNRRNIDFRNPLTSPDSAIAKSRGTWRRKVRMLETEEAFVRGPIKRIANNVVGTGFILQSKAEAEGLSKQIEGLFKKWSLIADIRRINTLSDILRTAQATMVRDGEVLLIGRESGYIHRSTPYCLEVLEVDRLTTPYKYRNDPKVKNGIRYDDDDAPSEYYILKKHPGSNLIPSISTGDNMDAYEVIRAEYDTGEKRVMHLFNPVRPEQSRGFSEFASSLENFENLNKYTDAEIYAAIEDACLTGFVKSENPDDFQQNFTVEDMPQADARIHEFGVNQIVYLNPNEDITMHTPTRPNNQLGEMINQLLRGPANSLDIPPEVLSQNWQGMNYSNARTVLLQFQHSMRIRQRYLIDHACIPIFNRFVQNLIIHGKLGRVVDLDDALRHTWIPPGWQWIDPLKEARGKAEEVNNNFDSTSAIIASRGQDPDEVFDQIERDAERMKKINEINAIIEGETTND